MGAPLLVISFFFGPKSLLIIVPVLIGVAFFTLLERKLLSLVGSRVGPNKVSFVGILQPIGDAVKLGNKSVNMLSNSSFFFYFFSSTMMFLSSLLLYSSLFGEPPLVSYKYSCFVVFLALAFNSFNSILSGWSTFSKYSLLGSLRTVSQLVSYEAILYLGVFLLVVCYNSFNFLELNSLHLPMLFLISPIFGYIWLPTYLAELNRTPYDFSEGESELVSGFNTEFGSSSFTLIFLAEYGNIIFLSLLTGVLFFSSLYGVFFFFFFTIWIRSVLPRFRFDKLMGLAWTLLIPLLTCIFLVYYIFIS